MFSSISWPDQIQKQSYTWGSTPSLNEESPTGTLRTGCQPLQTVYVLLWTCMTKSQKVEKEQFSATCSSLPACPLLPSQVCLFAQDCHSFEPPCGGGGSFCKAAPGDLRVHSGDYLCWLVLSIPLIISTNLVGSPWGYFSYNLNTFCNLFVSSDTCYYLVCSVRHSASLLSLYSP